MESELEFMSKKANFMSSVFGFEMESEVGTLAEEAALPSDLSASSLALSMDRGMDVSGQINGLDELNREDEDFDPYEYINDQPTGDKRRRI